LLAIACNIDSDAFITAGNRAINREMVYLCTEERMAMIKYTTQFLTKLEDLIAESDYTLRYEKGNFKSGFCVLKDQKIIIVNKFYPTEGKINALYEILRTVTLDTSRFTEKSQKLYEELSKQSAAA
jgi:hypothetical protein